MSVAVIGAGIGGMCTAARLARQGHDVTVFESSAFVGGKCRTEWIGKYAFDLGPSLLTIPAVYRDFFQKTGKHLGQVITLTPVDPSFDYRFTDGTSVKFANLSHHKTHDAIAESLGEDSAAQWSAMMKRAERMWDVSRGPFVESELRSISLFLSDLPFSAICSSSLRGNHYVTLQMNSCLTRSFATFSIDTQPTVGQILAQHLQCFLLLHLSKKLLALGILRVALEISQLRCISAALILASNLN
jgi:phytoene dehydrogenase-like protein